MKRLKVMTVVGTRPEIIRLSRVIAQLDEHTDHVLVHTGQNFDYELNEIFFQELGVRRPDAFLNAAGSSAAETIGQVLIKVDPLLEEHRPEALLLLGDTNSCLAAIPAKRRRIPIFHMEAGNRCYDQRVPEETNRKIVDHTSDINLPYSDIARENLLRENFDPARVIKTGSPMFEVLTHYREQIERSAILTELGLARGTYFVVSAHREENVDAPERLGALAATLNALAQQYGQRIIFSAHPRTQKRIAAAGLSFHPLVEVMKPLGFFAYVHLQMQARAVLSDSGTISEEASILNFPALTLRDTHERPEGMEETAVIMTGLNPERVLQAVAVLDQQQRGEQRQLRLAADYSMPNVSDKVLRLILSYTDYVNRYVWHQG
ncbi:non-hydrolyzing UDP-N-acetylglucosamine 2-epimerase [Deinococcus xianganensis]|uniref:UDP-N-acetylglucosamine 2-epimerase (Non-hydrolyzing) n=1 Tax=Deinococcus xianganensis TaxID=1507289 RepID=A0A6I4YEF3_9DEIO|nr:UDP-N-acetylglucosamine 2-epimerase (non-hydrolyzing) [Deinococcus xianganensis]MXV18264.1 UDP-N-acetylglucosamine 2-epimerase (non-hydrolyzing) [Deinococcus xianganensis]